MSIQVQSRATSRVEIEKEVKNKTSDRVLNYVDVTILIFEKFREYPLDFSENFRTSCKLREYEHVIVRRPSAN
jgi:hypothetical protein